MERSMFNTMSSVKSHENDSGGSDGQLGEYNPSSPSSVVIVAIVICVVFGVVALILVIWLVAKRRLGKNLEYESILKTSSKFPFWFRGDSKMAPTEICVVTPRSASPSCRSEASQFSVSSRPSCSGRSMSLDQSAIKKDIKALECIQSLGAIDPSLYKSTESGLYECDDDDFPDGHIGRIRFAVQYIMESEKLQVTLISAKNLPSRIAGTANACDPFVRLCLLPDTRSHMQTKFRKKTCNPKIEETFVFQVSSKNVDERVLKLTVYDVDRLRRHNVIGHVIYPLKNSGICETNGRIVLSRDLEHEVIEKSTEQNGEMLVSLSFNDRMERLNVGVYEAKNFRRFTESASPDFYVKISLMRNNSTIKTKKTDVIKGDCNPKFNESFAFKQSADSMDTASVVITAWHSLSGQRDKPVGRIVLGSFMYARGKELDHWNEMLANQKEQVSHWHALV